MIMTGIRRRLLAHLTATFLIVFGGVFSVVAAEEDAKPADQKTEAQAQDLFDFTVPEGTPEEILKFATELQRRRPKLVSREEFIDYAVKTQRALIAAGDKILDQKTDDETAVKAATLKMNALTMLAANQIGDSPKEALAAAIILRADDRKAVASVVEPLWPRIRVYNAGNMKAPELQELTDELVDAAVKAKFSRETVGVVSMLGDVLIDKEMNEEAAGLYDRLAKLVMHSEVANAELLVTRFEGIARRLRLPGNFMSLEGKTLDGKEFDWTAYRGKVVLVDFWATWCGPCIGELPNVKENYKKYHDKGFDIVAISLDRSRDPLEKFVEKEELPWTQLYEPEIQAGKGWNHPLAQHYGINSIPAAILVDKDGNVVSMKARGEVLTKLLEKLLGQ
ncbi:MAG: TlpA family protein disulfide reductase [Planctomycetes bacterium]|nr:TlpA family protein disulfide reductase [Planctomycetota bacterium]